MVSHVVHAGLAVVLVAALSSCGGDASVHDVSGDPSFLSKAAGDDQSAPVGFAVSIAPSVLVRNSAGAAVAGVLVSFTIATGAGLVDVSSAMTNVNGMAGVGRWMLGSQPGTNTLIASVPGLSSAVFTAVATVAPSTLPSIALSRSSASFNMLAAGHPTNQTIDVGSSGSGILAGLALNVAYLNSEIPWLFPSLSSPSTPSTLTLTVDPGSLSSGTYAATINVMAPGAANSPTPIYVVLTLGVAPPPRLIIAREPAGTVLGMQLVTQPIVHVLDANDDLALYSGLVRVSIASGPGTLTGTTAVNAALGVATFTNLGIGGAVGRHTLVFSSDLPFAATALSQLFTVTSPP